VIAVAKSERRFGPTLPDTDDDTVDPESHPIVPDDFIETMSSRAGREFDDFEEALRYAEKMPSSTDPTTLPRCVACGSVCVTTKTAMSKREHQRDPPKKCSACGEHMSTTLEPLEELGITAVANNTPFEWIHDADALDDAPEPSLHPDFPDLDERDADEAARWAVLLSKPWTDDDGLSLRETADHIPFSRAFVNRARQKWRAGELDEKITVEAALREVER